MKRAAKERMFAPMAFGNGSSLGKLMAVGEETVDSLRDRFGDLCLVVDTSELVQSEDWTATDASVRVHTPRGVTMFPRGASSIFPVVKKPTSTVDFVSVGRGEDNDVWLPHASVSRFHAYLHVSDEGVVVRDARSENGTFVQEKRIPTTGTGTAVTAARGETIQFGEVFALVLGPEDLHAMLEAR